MDPLTKQVREVTNASEAAGVDFHLNRKIIFFSDTEARKVYKLAMPKDLMDESQPLNISPIIDIANPGTWSPSAIAVDWIGNNLYVVDALGQKINVFDIEGLYSSIVVTSNLTSPVDIALDPIMGVMFVTDNNRVVRANMDGTHLRPLVEDAVSFFLFRCETVGDTLETHWRGIRDTLGTHWGRIGDASGTHRGRIGDASGTHWELIWDVLVFSFVLLLLL